MSLPGAPIGAEHAEGGDIRRFDHIPHLHELLPNGGWPGVKYAQVCVHNVANAKGRMGDRNAREGVERIGNLRPIRGTSYYAIEGPEGEAHMALVGTGAPIQGAAPEAGAREFYTDGEVARLTGHVVQYPIWLREPEVENEPESPPTQTSRLANFKGKNISPRKPAEVDLDA